jgi:hypothetical protein
MRELTWPMPVDVASIGYSLLTRKYAVKQGGKMFDNP